MWLTVAGGVESALECGEGERKCVGVWGEVRGDMRRSLAGAEEMSGECGWCEKV